MLRSVSGLQLQTLHAKRVCSLFSLFPTKHHLFYTHREEPQPLPSSSTHQANHSPIDLSSINISGIAKSVISRCSHLRHSEREASSKPSLKYLLLNLSNICPEIIRRFWRASDLKPADVLEILLGFQFDSGISEIEARKIQYLWEIFRWASDQGRGFKHLSRSCEVMAALLVSSRLFLEIELLLSTMESKGISLDSNEVFSNIIEGCVSANDLKMAISMYDRMRAQSLVPSLSCYKKILDLLVRMNKSQVAFRVYLDMVEAGLGASVAEMNTFDNVLQLLCRDGKVQQARDIVKKVARFGMKPSNLVLGEIATAYCEKRDYDDLLSFFVRMKCAPGVLACNKVIFSLCRDFSVERASFFLHEFEFLGFNPDEITFGILIGWSCREGKLKNAFGFMSNILSRGLKPDTHSYNALMSGLFKEGMWKCTRDILHEMDDQGINPNFASFRVLLAGYCKERQFDEVKVMVGEMEGRGLAQISSLGDPLSKAFIILGLDPLAVKVRRDNEVGFSNTQFFDTLGNGLYLETDLEKYEKTMTSVLEDSMIPDFNSFLLKHCGHGKHQHVVLIVDEMVRWGQELSLPVFSVLVKRLCLSSCMKEIASLLEKMPKLTNQLDQETLNLLVQTLSKNGLTYKTMLIFDEMLRQNLKIENVTFTCIMTALCKKGNLKDLLACWELAREYRWLPALNNCKALMGCLCQKEMLKEAMELFEIMMVAHPQMRMDIVQAFLEKLCGAGFTHTAHVMVEELLNLGYFLDDLAYSILIKGFYSEKKFSKALTVFDIMMAKNITPCSDVAVLLIPQLCRFGQLEKAIALKEISLTENSPLLLSVHCALLSGLCNTGMVSEAAKLLRDMLLKGLGPGAEIYNMLVQGYCQARNFKKVGELLSVMIRSNLIISISSYRNLVFLSCVEGRIPFVLSVKEFMLKGSHHPYLVFYNILVFCLFLTGNSLLVNTLLEKLREKRLQCDAVTYEFLVYGYSRCKAVSHSLQYLNDMVLKELKPSNRSLRAVISSLCGVGELVKAVELSQEMESRGWIHCSVIQNAIVEGFLAQGELQAATNFLDRMIGKDLIPQNVVYDNLIKKLCWHGKQDKAVDLLNTMLKKGNIPNSSSYDHVIQGFCTWRKLEKALDFHAEMLNRNLKPSIKTWHVLIHSFCHNGAVAEAERLMNSMVQIGGIPTREMYCSLINVYRSENNLRKASELLKMMQENGYEPDFETHWSLISNLSHMNDKGNSNSSRPFLSTLLSQSGFYQKKDP